jgi:hypothetical protein
MLATARCHDDDPSMLRWSTAWRDVVDGAEDTPSYEAHVARRVGIPLATAIVVAVVLATLAPPFACATPAGPHADAPADAPPPPPRPSVVRIACWSAAAGVATAALTHYRVFA